MYILHELPGKIIILQDLHESWAFEITLVYLDYM